MVFSCTVLVVGDWMSDKLNIKDEMRVLDTKDRKWWCTLTDEERTTFSKSMWPHMRWASSVKGSKAAEYLMLVNEFANMHFNVLKHHPQLQHQLLQLAGSGKPQYHEWIPPGKRGKKNKLTEWLATQYPQYNDDELELLSILNDKTEFKDIMEQHGMQPKEIKELLK
jgi:hypothetical protein|tara:strand:- start:759 stop:1259 length:501 start_codon:yes stop_codon:yes gene_type:complete